MKRTSVKLQLDHLLDLTFSTTFKIKIPLTVFLSPLLSLVRGYDLADILHDERAPLDVLQRLDSPAATVVGLVDAQLDLPAFLHHSVVAIGTALAQPETRLVRLSDFWDQIK